MNSKISGFFKLTIEERREKLKVITGLEDKDFKSLESLDLDIGNNMIENVIGNFTLPMGIATNFKVDGKSYLVPMVTEEASVIAAASNGAKLALPEGFNVNYTSTIMIGQIQILDIKDFNIAEENILENKDEILELANSKSHTMVKLGGGAVDLKLRRIEDMLIVNLLVDTLDAMGANAINTMVETVAPFIEDLTGGRGGVKILSNLAVGRLTKAEVTIRGLEEELVDGIVDSFRFAQLDPFRAVTHNKGIMNGIIALAMATGNDTRAIESAAHGYAAINGAYRPLTKWKKDEDNNLYGSIEVPIPIGLVGGATNTLPASKTALKILDINGVKELAGLMASVGLAQNLAALKALSTEGIQRGHMNLHGKNIAIAAGARGKEVDILVEQMIEEGEIKLENAKEILKSIRDKE